MCPSVVTLSHSFEHVVVKTFFLFSLLSAAGLIIVVASLSTEYPKDWPDATISIYIIIMDTGVSFMRALEHRWIIFQVFFCIISAIYNWATISGLTFLISASKCSFLNFKV